MNTFVPLEKLNSIDLKDYYEVWLTTSETWPQDPATVSSQCLWRADRELTKDVVIDAAYFQNLPHLWIVVDQLHDATSTDPDLVRDAVESRVKQENLGGEFYPQDEPEGSSEGKNTDLRS